MANENSFYRKVSQSSLSAKKISVMTVLEMAIYIYLLKNAREAGSNPASWIEVNPRA